MGAKTIVGISCGLFCGIGGLFCVIFAWAFLHPKKQELYNMVHDAMFIDDPMDSTKDYDSPVEETEQYQSWSERDDGLDVTYSVFDITNPGDVVQGAKPIIQEVGPIYAVRFGTKIVSNANKSDWSTSGIARFKQKKEYYLNNVTCDTACVARLGQTVTIPSPMWAATSMWGQTTLLVVAWYFGMISQGVQTALGCSLTAHPQLPTCTPTQLAAFAGAFDAQLMSTSPGGLMAQSPGGLSATADEAAAWRGAITSADMLSNIGMFLESAGAVAAGNLPYCFVGGLPPSQGGTGTVLSAPRCGHFATTFMTKASLITQLYTAAVASAPIGYGGSPMYGMTGSWSPVFAPVTAAQLLNFKTDAFDPAAPTLGLPVPALRDYPAYWSPDAEQRSLDSVKWHGMQMASQFGAQGTRYYVEFGDYGETQDCRMDMNCWPLSPIGGAPSWTLVEGDSDNCVAGGPRMCSPLVYGHYSLGNIPGRNFETSKGFSDFDVGTIYQVMNEGAPLEMKVKEEKTQTHNDGEIKYWEVGINKIPRSTMNCPPPAAGILPGVDCMGPAGASMVGPILGGTIAGSFYAALPFFDQSLAAAGPDTAFTGYDPASAVTLQPCTGNAYCDNRPSDFWMLKVKIEPETGLMYHAHAPVMFGLGIFPSNGSLSGQGNNLLTPLVPKAVIPVFIGTTSGGATDDQLDQLVQLQGAPDMINMITILLTIGGIVMLVGSCSLFALAALDMRSSKSVTPTSTSSDDKEIIVK